MLRNASNTTPRDRTMTNLFAIPKDICPPLGNSAVELAQLSLASFENPLPLHERVWEIFGGPPQQDHVSMVFVDSVDIHCSVVGLSSVSYADEFVLQALGSQTISELRRMMKKEKPVLASQPLTLYRVSYNEKTGFVATHSTPLAEMLDGSAHFTSSFANQPFHEFLAIIVKIRIQEVKHLPDWTPAERRTKRPKLLEHSPSSIDPPEYRKLQSIEDERTLDYRFPHLSPAKQYPDEKLPPIETLFEGFGLFLESWRAEYQPGFEIATLTEDMKEDVDAFVHAMSETYSDESLRRESGLAHLNTIFRQVLGGQALTNETIRFADKTRLRTDGQFSYGSFHIPCVLVEFKNEATGTVMPVVELNAYYTHMVHSIGQLPEEPGDMHSCSRFPTLGITIAGPVVTMFSTAYVGRVVSVPLTPGLCCLPVQCGGSDRQLLYAAFAAASRLIAQIIKHAETLSTGTLPIILDFDSKTIHRHLYRATSVESGTHQPKQLVIKLSYSYSVRLHEFCAARGHAPALYAAERLPGGIWAIAMEYLEGDSLESVPADTRRQYREKWAKDLTKLAKEVHDAGYVHGDIRAPNIICSGDKIALLDFDWGGEKKIVSYPSRKLNPQLTRGRDMRNLMITEDDDIRVLRETLQETGLPILL
ncbi:hypothetical protein JVU11DRAFT_6403 [Chiua virens]|nr:hypothetical protein JVU11DRAFT_6403 [Chiua virens]